MEFLKIDSEDLYFATYSCFVVLICLFVVLFKFFFAKVLHTVIFACCAEIHVGTLNTNNYVRETKK